MTAELPNRLDMLLKPGGEFLSRHLAIGEREHQPFLLLEPGIEFSAIEQQKHFHRGVCDSFVSIDEWMVHHEREGKSGSLGRQRWVQVDAAKCGGSGLSQRGFEQSQISDTWRAAGLFEQGLMEVDNFAERQISHQARRLYSS